MYIHQDMTTAAPIDERQQRGLIIAATMPIKSSPGRSASCPRKLNGKYRVDGLAMTCSCPDFGLRRLPCKYVFAVKFVRRRETTTRPDGTTTVTETTGVRVAYGQDWSAYNRSQQVE